MIRILRIMEYEYPDGETAQEDMSHWSIPSAGTMAFGKKIIRSAVIMDLSYHPEAYETIPTQDEPRVDEQAD